MTSTTTLVLIGVIVFATMSLFIQKSFPNRRRALVMSWVGPVLLSVGAAYAESLRNNTASAKDMCVVLHGITTSVIVGGWMSALLMVWLWRGYGLIVLLAGLATFGRNSFRHQLKRMAAEYPWRLWYVIPILFIVVAFATLTMVNCVFAPMLTHQ